MSKNKFPHGTTPSGTGCTHAIGGCYDCDFEIEGRNVAGLMAQHAGRTGHRCWAEIAKVTRWNDPKWRKLTQTKH
ncbi:MAG: hypothetical protein OXI59_13720 [Gemmatimonadota bacterium]|nr:hypothetical protein [Gemmatimonadota bacterium]